MVVWFASQGPDKVKALLEHTGKCERQGTMA